ncbi:MAG: hypothetical protein H0X12_18520 [Nocardioides sp.]|nr:hypothetical protein [Nocardioides sp.]
MDHADYYIGFWRNRPGALPTAIEEIFARVVNSRPLSVGTSHNKQLAGVVAVLTGDEVDLDELDEETRRTGSRAADAVAELLESIAKDYTGTDDRVRGAFSGMTPS